MYKNTGRDENGYAVYEDTSEKTAEQIVLSTKISGIIARSWPNSPTAPIISRSCAIITTTGPGISSPLISWDTGTGK